MIYVGDIVEKYSSRFISFIEESKTVKEFIVGTYYFSLWYESIEKMSQKQFVFTGDISEEFALKVIQSDDVCVEIKEYYLSDNGKRLNALINRYLDSDFLDYNLELFEQSVSAYRQGSIHLACVGLFAVIDGYLSTVSEDATTSFYNRFQSIENKLDNKTPLSEIDKRVFAVYISFKNFDNTVFKNSKFSETEPEGINRHWALHGRSKNEYLETDFIKLLLWIDALRILNDSIVTDDE